MEVGNPHHTQNTLPTRKSPSTHLKKSLGVPLRQYVKVQTISAPWQFEIQTIHPKESRYTSYAILVAKTPKILNKY
jgi:hypothetical protein